MSTPHTPIALVTGASGGIGLELAREFARNGFQLVIVARSEAKLQALAEELAPVPANCIAQDLSMPGAAGQLYHSLKQLGLADRISVLVNNAGFGDFAPFAETPLQKYSEMMRLNMLTLTELTHLLLPQMIAEGRGRVLNVASTAAFMPGPLMAVYFATKAFVLSFSEALHEEMRRQKSGITVTCLCPGPTESGFQAAARMETSRLIKGRKLPTSAQVARYGYAACMRGQAVAVHGWLNKLLVLSAKLSPRGLGRRIAYSVIKSSH